MRPGRSRTQRATYSRIARAAFTSMPSVGSSRNTTSGSLTKPRAKFMRWRCPVESRLMRVRACSREPRGLDERVDARPGDRAGHAVELREHPQALAHGQDAVAARSRRPRPARCACAPPGRRGRRRSPATRASPRSREQQRGEDLDERGLAGAVGAQQPEDLAALDAHVHAVERADLAAAARGAERAGEPAHLDRRRVQRSVRSHGSAEARQRPRRCQTRRTRTGRGTLVAPRPVRTPGSLNSRAAGSACGPAAPRPRAPAGSRRRSPRPSRRRAGRAR